MTLVRCLFFMIDKLIYHTHHILSWICVAITGFITLGNIVNMRYFVLNMHYEKFN